MRQMRLIWDDEDFEKLKEEKKRLMKKRKLGVMSWEAFFKCRVLGE